MGPIAALGRVVDGAMAACDAFTGAPAPA